MVRRYREERLKEKELKDATVNRDLSVLRRVLYWGVEEGLLAANPLGRLRMERERRTKRPVMSLAEERLLTAAAPDHLKRIILCALHTGMRRGVIDITAAYITPTTCLYLESSLAMHLGRKRAVSMVIAVLLWTAAPLLACVPGLETDSKADCCAGMAMPDCDSDSMASGSCCQLVPTPTNPVLIFSNAPQRGPEAGVPIWEARLPAANDAEITLRTFHDTPPPDPSPGGFSVLRT